MHILIKMIYGKTILLTVEPGTTIREIKNTYMADLIVFGSLPTIKVDGKTYHYRIKRSNTALTDIISHEEIEVYERTTNTEESVRNALRFIFAGKEITDEMTLEELNVQNESTLYHVHGIGPDYYTDSSYYKSVLYRMLDGHFVFDEEIKAKVCKKINIEISAKVTSLYQICLNFFKSNPQNLRSDLLERLNINIREDLLTFGPTSFEDLWKYEQDAYKQRVKNEISNITNSSADHVKQIKAKMKRFLVGKLITSEAYDSLKNMLRLQSENHVRNNEKGKEKENENDNDKPIVRLQTPVPVIATPSAPPRILSSVQQVNPVHQSLFMSNTSSDIDEIEYTSSSQIENGGEKKNKKIISIKNKTKKKLEKRKKSLEKQCEDINKLCFLCRWFVPNIKTKTDKIDQLVVLLGIIEDVNNDATLKELLNVTKRTNRTLMRTTMPRTFFGISFRTSRTEEVIDKILSLSPE